MSRRRTNRSRARRDARYEAAVVRQIALKAREPFDAVPRDRYAPVDEFMRPGHTVAYFAVDDESAGGA